MADETIQLSRYVFNPVYVHAMQYRKGVEAPGVFIYGRDLTFQDGTPLPTHWESGSGRGIDIKSYTGTAAVYASEPGEAFFKNYDNIVTVVPEGIWIIVRADGQMFLIGDEAFRRHYSDAPVPPPVEASPRTRPIEV